MRYKQRLGALSGLAFAVGLTVSQGAIASPLTAGFDLLSTPDGTVTLNLGAIGLVTFNGNPIDTLRAAFGMSPLGLGTGPLGTDTVMLRDSGINAFPDTIPLEMVSLSLKSVGPVDTTPAGVVGFADVYVIVNKEVEDIGAIGGNDDGNCDLGEACVRLLPAAMQPDALSASLGQMTIRHENIDSGTFDSFFDVFVDLVFTEVNNPANILISNVVQDRMESSGSSWSHNAPVNYPVNSMFPAGEFYPGVDGAGMRVLVNHAGGPHPQTFAASTVPEPTSLVLLGLGLAAIGVARSRKRV